MLNVLILGVGQCGNRILDAVNKEAMGWWGCLEDRQVLSQAQIPQPGRDGGDQHGDKRSQGAEIHHRQRQIACSEPARHGSQQERGQAGLYGQPGQHHGRDREEGDFDLAFVLTSTSGGTGSSFSPLLINELKRQYPNITVVTVAILPFREEGSIYLQNAAFSMRELMELDADGIILADNQYMKRFSGDIASAYDKINSNHRPDDCFS